ncbi:UNVERIFIED_CONTAM: hypothetical protein Sradi_6117700 [Sesamum radiatum]|uniref:Uncharacterized protein n=1 Tax=Sesamum radiatum TaxID=300843 RepID=A0AAW2KJK7_SESRA
MKPYQYAPISGAEDSIYLPNVCVVITSLRTISMFCYDVLLLGRSGHYRASLGGGLSQVRTAGRIGLGESGGSFIPTYLLALVVEP